MLIFHGDLDRTFICEIGDFVRNMHALAIAYNCFMQFGSEEGVFLD